MIRLVLPTSSKLVAEFNYSASRIEALLDKAEALFRRRFLAAVVQIRDTVTLSELETLLSVGRFDEALVQAEFAATQIANAYVSAYLLAADDVMRFISNAIGITVQFDQVNTRAVQHMRDASLRLIQEFTSGQRAATRVALVSGIRQGLNPRETARLFRMSIGLTAKQMSAVVNFRRLLEQGSAAALTRALRDKRFDASILRAVRDEKPLTADQIDRMVQRYYERSLASRAQTIARTESLTAVHLGSDQGFQQAMDLGLITDEISQTWHTAGDARVRHPSHTRMQGQVRPFGQPFISGTGNQLRYPGDHRAPSSDTIRCRCAKSTRFTSDTVAA